MECEGWNDPAIFETKNNSILTIQVMLSLPLNIIYNDIYTEIISGSIVDNVRDQKFIELEH